MIDIPDGHLYLGEGVDPGTRARDGTPVLVEAADLTTHGVIVGMTGSGKTGLGVVLLEEALLAGIPTLVVDPKGDLGNLLLTFPELRPEDFAPWVEGDDAAAVATTWTEGLAGWGIGPERVAALRDAAEFTIYTPGSTAGVPLDIVGGLARPTGAGGAPPDAETVTDEIEGFVSGLLTMVGIEADPLAGREHILLSNLIDHAWASGQDLDLATLVVQVQDPPLRKLGVYELDAFYPAKERAKLAMTLNGLLASRSFAAWGEGPDLDIDRLLRSADGSRPACAIVSLAHLSDEERQFIVSLLLGRLITWMRRQAGTDTLRLLVYFDEVMGFVPPTAAPPAKKPILTLFKQARAFGVGMVLATQNPVDVDYKGLANAGTWMIGRLQTEQDKSRLLDGLSSAGGAVDVGAVGDAIGGLGKREFMLRSPGADAPSLFTSRWAMSYLRGPLTREQIATLMAGRWPAPEAEAKAGQAASGAPPAPATEPADTPALADAPTAAAPTEAGDDAAPAPPLSPAAATSSAEPTPPDAAAPSAAPPTAAPTDAASASPTVAGDDAVPAQPPVAEGVPVRWLDPAAPWAGQVGAVAGGTRCTPSLVIRVSLLYDDDKLDLRETEEWEAVLFPLTATVDPASALAVDHDERDLRTEPPPGATYARGDAPLDRARWFADVEKAVVDHLYRSRTRQVLRNGALDLVARPGEGPDEFAARCRDVAAEGADAAQVALQDKYGTRLAKARDALDAARDKIAQAEAAQATRRSSDLVAGAGSLLGAVLGGRRSARRVARDVGRVVAGKGRSDEAAQRVRSARNREEDRIEALERLEADLAHDLTAIDDEWNSRAAEVETIEVPLERSDIRVTARSVVWVPGPAPS